jgi:nitroreductase
MTDAPIVLVMLGEGVHRVIIKGTKTEKDWLMFDSGLAMQNLCLVAHYLGLGTVIVEISTIGQWRS